MTILYPILLAAGPYLAVMLGLGVCIFLFVSVKAEHQLLIRRMERALDELKQQIQTAESNAAELHAQVQAAEEQLRISSGAPVKSWNNINRRTQVLRKLRAGERPQVIANELGMSRGEVDLLLKVHRVVINSYDSPTTPESSVAEENSICFLNA